MLDHISIRVADYDRSKKFYEAALAPLGYTLAMEADSGAGFRRGFIPDFWIKQGEPIGSAARAESTYQSAGCGGPAVHVAFSTDDRSTVDAFYQAALAAGARDNGAPGLRPNYHPNYYGAFVLDRMGTTSKRFATRQNELTKDRSGPFQGIRSTRGLTIVTPGLRGPSRKLRIDDIIFSRACTAALSFPPLRP